MIQGINLENFQEFPRDFSYPEGSACDLREWSGQESRCCCSCSIMWTVFQFPSKYINTRCFFHVSLVLSVTVLPPKVAHFCFFCLKKQKKCRLSWSQRLKESLHFLGSWRQECTDVSQLRRQTQARPMHSDSFMKLSLTNNQSECSKPGRVRASSETSEKLARV